MDSTARPNRTLSLVMVLILVLVPVACGGKKSEPPGPSKQELQEEAARQAAEKETPPEPPQNESRAASAEFEKKMREAPHPAAPPSPPPPPEPVPYEQAFPEDFKSIPPVRIGVLSSPNRPEAHGGECNPAPALSILRSQAHRSQNRASGMDAWNLCHDPIERFPW